MQKWGGALKKKKIKKKEKISRMDLPAAFFFLFEKKCFFSFFSAKQSKIDPKKKGWNSEKSVHGTGFWIKRQTGNVLLIVIFVIRTCLAEAAT